MKIITQKQKNRRNLALILLGFGWAIFFFMVYQHFSAKKQPAQPFSGSIQINGGEIRIDETPVTDQKKDEHKVPASHPRFISVPDLGVERARVVSIGVIAKTSQLDSPISIHDAGWYYKSSTPGGRGALLMDGHNGGPNYGGIFDKLGQLQVGAKIIVERGDGEKFTYEVRDNRQITIDQANDASNKFGMSTMLESIDPGAQGLNIITCVGNWLPEKQTFDQRVMLRAVRV